MLKLTKYLMEIRSLIDQPEHWAKDWFAYNKYGTIVDANDSTACSWCIMGAAEHVTAKHDANHVEQQRIFHALCGGIVGLRDTTSGLATYNDAETTTHKDIMAVIDRAALILNYYDGKDLYHV